MNLRHRRYWEDGVSVPTTQLILRGLILAAGLIALTGTRLTGSAAPLYVELTLFGLVLLCVAKPDSHASLVLIVLLATNWVFTVPEQSAWILCPGISFAVIHVSSAAASTGPLLVTWSNHARRRWFRRALVLATSPVVVWLIILGFERIAPSFTAWIGAVAVLVIGAGAAWINPGRSR